MSFFQNPFHNEFRGNMLLGDRQHIPTFVCPPNYGRGDDIVISWSESETFDLSGNDQDSNARDTLNIRFSKFPNFEAWTLVSIDITASASSTSAVTPAEIVTALNSAAAFSDWFTASLNSTNGRVQIKSKEPSTSFHFYVVNGQAEEALLFNKRAGVAELPSYFDRHKVTHLFSTLALLQSFPDRLNALIPLDPSNDGGSSAVDDDIIDNAVDKNGNSKGFSSSTVQEDYELLEGRSGIFTFQKITVDASDRITQIIEYPAGAKAGDLARKIAYSYTGAKTKPDQITEIPYTLASGDLVTP